MLKIGDFSGLSRISVRMLRYYDEAGLLRPVEVDRYTGYRYYSEEQLVTAGRITVLRDMGFGITKIAELLPVFDNAEALERCLMERRGELMAEKDAIARTIQLLDSLRNQLRKEQAMNYSVEVKTIPERYAACVRRVIPSYEDEGMLWSDLMSETMPRGIPDGEPCLCCAVFHDNEWKEKDVDVEVQKTVKGTWSDSEHVRFRSLPAVEVASVIHRGSYSGIGDAAAALAAWVGENGYEYNGEVFYIYHVSPHESDDPNEFVTELCYPVRKV